MGFEISKAINFGITSWFKQEGMPKLLAVFFIVSAIITLGSLYVSNTFFGGIFSGGASATAVMSSFGNYFLWMIVIGIISFLVNAAFGYAIISKALKAKKISSGALNFDSWIRFVILQIAEVVVAALSIFDLKKLWILVAALVLLLLSIAIGSIASAIGVILLVIYLIVVVRNCIRLSVTQPIFVMSGAGVMRSLKASWSRTSGNTWNVFFALVVLAIIAIIITFVFAIPSTIYSTMSVLTSAISGSTATVAILSDPVYQVLMLVALIGQVIAMAVSMFTVVGIYTELSTSAVAAAAPKRVASKRVAPKKAAKRKARK